MISTLDKTSLVLGKLFSGGNVYLNGYEYCFNADNKLCRRIYSPEGISFSDLIEAKLAFDYFIKLCSHLTNDEIRILSKTEG